MSSFFKNLLHFFGRDEIVLSIRFCKEINEILLRVKISPPIAEWISLPGGRSNRRMKCWKTRFQVWGVIVAKNDWKALKIDIKICANKSYAKVQEVKVIYCCTFQTSLKSWQEALNYYSKHFQHSYRVGFLKWQGWIVTFSLQITKRRCYCNCGNRNF